MMHTFSHSDGYNSSNTPVLEETFFDYSWAVPSPPQASPRPYGEQSWEWTSPFQIRRSPLVPMSPRNFEYSSSSSPVSEEVTDYSWPVPPQPQVSPRPYGEPSWEWPTPLPSRPQPLVPMPPRNFKNIYNSVLRNNSSEPSFQSRTHQYSFSNTPIMDDNSWAVPQTPPASPRRYGEPSWEWTSPLQIRRSPLVPMSPRNFETSDPAYRSLPRAFSEPSLQLRTETSGDRYIDETPRGPPLYLGPRRLNFSSASQGGRYRSSVPTRNISPAKELMIAKLWGQKILDDMKVEDEMKNQSARIMPTKMSPRQIGDTPRLVPVIKEGVAYYPARELKGMTVNEMKQKLAKELLDIREKFILVLELYKTLLLERPKVESMYLAKNDLNRTLTPAYEQIHQLVEKTAIKLGPEFEDPKYIMAQGKEATERVQNYIHIYLERANNVQKSFDNVLEFVKQLDEQLALKEIPLKDHFNAVHKMVFGYNILLNDERNKKDVLRYDIVNEKSKSKEYEDQRKMETLAMLRLRDTVNRIRNQLNHFKQIIGLPPAPPSPDIQLLHGEVAELMSELVDEIKVNKELTEYATKVPPKHIMNILKRYLRAESYRKALTWQKKYLLLALRNCENDHEYNRFQFEKRRFNAKGLWRVAANVVIAIFRTQNLVRNRSTNHQTVVSALQQAYVNTEA